MAQSVLGHVADVKAVAARNAVAEEGSQSVAGCTPFTWTLAEGLVGDGHRCVSMASRPLRSDTGEGVGAPHSMVRSRAGMLRERRTHCRQRSRKRPSEDRPPGGRGVVRKLQQIVIIRGGGRDLPRGMLRCEGYGARLVMLSHAMRTCDRPKPVRRISRRQIPADGSAASRNFIPTMRSICTAAHRGGSERHTRSRGSCSPTAANSLSATLPRRRAEPVRLSIPGDRTTT